MARLLPKENPSSIESLPERIVAEALCSQMQDKVVIFHSYPWLRPERDLIDDSRRNPMREGEADFVILHPRYGIMVVEVKGGHLYIEPGGMKWKRAGGQHEVKDPFEQASRNLRAIQKQLSMNEFNGAERLPFCLARCVVFPQGDFEGTMPPGAHPHMLFTASDLSQIGRKVEALFAGLAFVPNEPLPQDILNKLTRGLTSSFRMVPALWADIDSSNRRIFRMTQEQEQLLLFMQSHKRAAIEGVAGSGKTVLAMSKARHFADEGLRVLFLCYNSMLAKSLEMDLPSDYRNRITITNYHRLCSSWAKQAGLAWPQISNDETAFFVQQAPAILCDAIDALPDLRFDAVVVDEAQDFHPNWWDTIEFINKGENQGPLYVFYDPEQNIFFKEQQAMPNLGNPFVLPTNCRNTEQISGYCGAIIQKQIPTKFDAPKGPKPTLITAKTEEDRAKVALEQVEFWLKDPQRLKPSQIAIITRGHPDNSSIRAVRKIGKYPVTNDLASWRDDQGILITSIYRFKGLEADALVLVDIPDPDPHAPPEGFRPSHFYVACSRARNLLTIIKVQE